MTTWGRTYYNNIMTFIVFLPLAFFMGEHNTMSSYLSKGMLTTDAMLLLIASCIWGTAISFLGFC
jgi:ABC-type long-subunit fatty acid transport system fused permease/ATPase subunit